MIKIIFTIPGSLFSLIPESKRELLSIINILKKENEILKRTMGNYNIRICFTNKDRLSFSLFNFLSEKVREFLTLVKPETVLNWYQNFIRNRFNFSCKSKRKPGRPPTPADIKNLILDMKNKNLLNAYRKNTG